MVSPIRILAAAVCLLLLTSCGCQTAQVAKLWRREKPKESLARSEPAELPKYAKKPRKSDIELTAAEEEVLPAPPAATVREPDPQPVAEPNDDSLTQPIDLTTALMLTNNGPQVAFARSRIEESFAQLDRAEALWLPSLRAGINYNKHDGAIQSVAGPLINTSRNALYGGLGANALGAGSPGVPGLLAQFHLTDAVFSRALSAKRSALASPAL